MIPSDIGVRLRTDAEALLQPTPAVPEIPADLPELRPGQGFSARILEVLPQNTYRALVAGKTVTLALPEGAKQGDVLDLQVIDRTPRTIVAQLTPATAQDSAEAIAGGYRYATLSPAAQLIGDLLPAAGEKALPAALTRGEPVTGQPPLHGADLVSGLARAIARSGLFYEAHQAQWIAGQLPLQQLLAEPQGRHSNPATLLAHGLLPEEYRAPITALPVDTPSPGKDFQPVTSGNSGSEAARESPMAALLRALFGGEDVAEPGGRPTTATVATVPEDLKPLIQQQLDGAAGQRLAWHGEVWPRQALDWEIEWPRRDAGAGEPGESWTTRLALTTPRLGPLDARLSLSGQDLRLIVSTPVGASAADLRDASPLLASALEAAGLRLAALQIHHDAE